MNIIKSNIMNKKNAKKEAYKIASIVISELESSDCTNSVDIKNELRKIASFLSKKAEDKNITK